MNIHTLIGVTDFSALGDAALDRAALLAQAHCATLEIVGLPLAEGTPGISAAVRLTQAARRLATCHQLTFRPIGRVLSNLSQLAGQADRADLIVLPAGRDHPVQALLLGSTAHRLLRLSACPVLVVKQAPKQRYQQILVAIDFRPSSQALAEQATRIDTDSAITLFHALDTQIETRLRSSDVSPDVIRDWQTRCLHDARERLDRFAERFGAQRARIRHAFGRGAPGHQVALRQQRDGADLTVVGKQRGSLFTDLLFGSVAHQVLREATCDVLIVPHDFQLRGRRLPLRSAAADRADGGLARGTVPRSVS